MCISILLGTATLSDIKDTITVKNAAGDVLMVQTNQVVDASTGRVQAESNEPQMQMTSRPTQMIVPQNITHKNYGMDFDENEDYVNRDFYDSDGNLRELKEQLPPEVKELREDYIRPLAKINIRHEI